MNRESAKKTLGLIAVGVLALMALGGCENVLGLPGYNAPPYRLNFRPTTSLVPVDTRPGAPSSLQQTFQ